MPKQGIGYLNDDTALVAAAAEYLKRHQD